MYSDDLEGTSSSTSSNSLSLIEVSSMKQTHGIVSTRPKSDTKNEIEIHQINTRFQHIIKTSDEPRAK